MRKAICYRLQSCIGKLNRELNEAKSQYSAVTKKSDPTGEVKAEFERQMCYFSVA